MAWCWPWCWLPSCLPLPPSLTPPPPSSPWTFIQGRSFMDRFKSSILHYKMFRFRPKPSEVELLLVGRIFVLVLVAISVVWIPIIQVLIIILQNRFHSRYNLRRQARALNCLTTSSPSHPTSLLLFVLSTSWQYFGPGWFLLSWHFFTSAFSELTSPAPSGGWWLAWS